MRVIILAAGQSQRFKDEGYIVPKPFLLINWRGRIKTMLEHVMCTVPFFFSVTVGIPQGWLKETENLSVKGLIDFIEIDNTSGPAHTTLQILQFTEDENTLIIDVDVLNATNDLHKLSTSSYPGVLVSESADPAFSYVDNLGLFLNIKEKSRISDYAVQGAYYFPEGDRTRFIDTLKEVVMDTPEPYLSHVFDRLTGRKYSYLTSYIPIAWGTPRDVKQSGAHIVTTKGG